MISLDLIKSSVEHDIDMRIVLRT